MMQKTATPRSRLRARAAAPKLDMSKIPAFGADPNVTKENFDKWWDKYLQQKRDSFGDMMESAKDVEMEALRTTDPAHWDKATVMGRLSNAASDARKELDIHSGWTANLSTNKYLSSLNTYADPGADKLNDIVLNERRMPTWQEKKDAIYESVMQRTGLNQIRAFLPLLRGPNQVDEDWISAKAGETTTDPIDSTINRLKSQVFFPEASAKAQNAIRKDTAAMHLIGKVSDNSGMAIVDGVRRLIPGIDHRNWTERSTGETSEELLQDYKKQYADAFGQEAAQKAEQWMRLGGNVLGITSGVSTAVAVGHATGTLGANSMVGRAVGAQGVPTVVTPGMGYLQQAARSWAAAYAAYKPFGVTFKAVGDELSNGGQRDGIMGGAGAVFDFAGDIANDMPEVAAAGSLIGPIASKANKLIGKVPVIGRPVAKFMIKGPGRWFKRSQRWNPSGWKKPLGWLVASFADDAMVDPTIRSPLLSLDNFAQGKWVSHSPGPTVHALNTAIKKLSALNPTLDRLLNSGEGADMVEKEIAEYLESPDTVAVLKSDLGMPESATVEQVRDVLYDIKRGQQYSLATTRYLKELDKNFNWDGVSPEEVDAHLKTFTKEQIGAAKYSAFNRDAYAGVPLMSDYIFMDDDLSKDQKNELLKTIIATQDRRNGGSMVGQWFGQWSRFGRSEEKIVMNAMDKSPEARRAIVAYAQSAVSDVVNGKSDSVQMDDMQKKVLENLTDDELMDTLAPVGYATPKQLLDLQSSGSLGGVPNKKMEEMATDIVMYRMHTDGTFASEYIQQYADAVKNAKGVPASAKSNVADNLSKLDPDAIFANMDDDQFQSTARAMLSMMQDGNIGSLGEDDTTHLKERFTEAAKKRAMEAIKTNPAKNIPVMTSLWMKSNGWDRASDLASNPGTFWGIAALMLTGGVWLGASCFSGSASDSFAIQPADPSSMVMSAMRQRSLLDDDDYGM